MTNSTIDQFVNRAKSAYRNAESYRANGHNALANLWELLAMYYLAVAYESEPYDLMNWFDQYGDFEALVQYISDTIVGSLPRTISERSMGGFGYHGETPIGDTWGIILSYAPNVADVLSESNWKVITQDMIDQFDDQTTIEYFSSWITGTENLMIKLLEDNGHPTNAAIRAMYWHDKLENYPVASEDHYSELEFEYESQGNSESVDSVMRSLYTTEDMPDNSTEIILNWLQDNAPNTIERASYGYSNGGGWIDDTPIKLAAYLLGYIDLTMYDPEDLTELESELESYIWEDIDRAFVGYKSKL